MRTKILVVLALAIFVAPASAFAQEDFCTSASRALHMTDDQISNFFEQNIENHFFHGSGKVVDMKGDPAVDQSFTIQIDCGNGVLMIIYTDSFFVKRNNVAVGAYVSFNGNCSNLRRPYPMDNLYIFDPNHIVGFFSITGNL